MYLYSGTGTILEETSESMRKGLLVDEELIGNSVKWATGILWIPGVASISALSISFESKYAAGIQKILY